jgi:hypothetical protein
MDAIPNEIKTVTEEQLVFNMTSHTKGFAAISTSRLEKMEDGPEFLCEIGELYVTQFQSRIYFNRLTLSQRLEPLLPHLHVFG